METSGNNIVQELKMDLNMHEGKILGNKITVISKYVYLTFDIVTAICWSSVRRAHKTEELCPLKTSKISVVRKL